MSSATPIQWCDSTINPTSGCDGCELFRPNDPDSATCYARLVHLQRLTKAPALKASGHYAPAFSEVRMIPGRMAEAAAWSDLRGKQREHKGWLDALPRHIFVGDLSDVLSSAVTDHFIETEIFQAMESEKGRRHVWLLLTKRPQRLAELSLARGGLPDNCVAMTSVTSRRTYDARVPHLLRVQCRWRGISAEPLLESIASCLDGLLGPRLAEAAPGVFTGPQVHWVIVGGESGPQARPCDAEWIREIVGACRAAGVLPFVKQLGSAAVDNWTKKPMALADAKGGDWNEWPDYMRVREMPDFSAVEVVR